MPTAAERQAHAFLAGVALLGGGARSWMQHRTSEAALLQNVSTISAESVEGQLSLIDSAKASHRGKKRSPKSPRTSSEQKLASRAQPSPGESFAVIDVDVASAEELESLPRVGPTLAQRIVANRDSLGVFGSLEALGEVRGIGPAMLKVLSPLVAFSGRPRESNVKANHRRVRR